MPLSKGWHYLFCKANIHRMNQKAPTNLPEPFNKNNLFVRFRKSLCLIYASAPISFDKARSIPLPPPSIAAKLLSAQ